MHDRHRNANNGRITKKSSRVTTARVEISSCLYHDCVQDTAFDQLCSPCLCTACKLLQWFSVHPAGHSKIFRFSFLPLFAEENTKEQEFILPLDNSRRNNHHHSTGPKPDCIIDACVMGTMIMSMVFKTSNQTRNMRLLCKRRDSHLTYRNAVGTFSLLDRFASLL